MDKSEVKELRKEIKLELNLRKSFVAKDEARRKHYKKRYAYTSNLFSFVLVMTPMVLIYFYLNSELKPIHFLKAMLILLTVHFGKKMYEFFSLIKPKERDLDEWYWETENKITKNGIWLISVGVPFMLIVTEPPSILIPILLFFGITGLLYFSMTIYVKKKPELFLNNKYTETASFFGSLSGLLILSSIPLYFTKYFFVNEYDEWQILVLFLALIIISLWAQFEYNNKLNICQKFALKLTKPYNILDILKSKDKKLKEEIKGLEMFGVIEKHKSTIIEKVILTKLSDKYKQKTNWFFRGLILIIASIIGALAESFVQDLFWTDEIKEIICSKIELFC